MSQAHTKHDDEYMALALQLAERGLYTTQPNPRVGCVLVRDGIIVGQGWHQRAGHAHAEINALKDAGTRAQGATAYVTLEPCSHHGRTPPCAEALLEAGIKRVVCALTDPNPNVSGQGIELLRAGGIQVDIGSQEGPARALNAGFIKRMTRSKPLVRLKIAASLDGRTALASGESRWITSAAARADGHRLRARSCAVVTGRGTVEADNPQLTVRDAGIRINRQPLRVVLDSQGRLPDDVRLLQDGGETRVLTVQGNEREKGPVRVEKIRASGHLIDLHAAIKRMAHWGCNEVLIEAGATLNGAFLQAGLVDEIVVYMAPVLLGDQGRGMFSIIGLERMGQRPRLELIDQRPIGVDWRLTYQPIEGY